jgi:hypothetical protein
VGRTERCATTRPSASPSPSRPQPFLTERVDTPAGAHGSCCVAYTGEEMANGAEHNMHRQLGPLGHTASQIPLPRVRVRSGPKRHASQDSHGVSAFALEDDVVYHTYSSYARGNDVLGACSNGSTAPPKDGTKRAGGTEFRTSTTTTPARPDACLRVAVTDRASRRRARADPLALHVGLLGGGTFNHDCGVHYTPYARGLDALIRAGAFLDRPPAGLAGGGRRFLDLACRALARRRIEVTAGDHGRRSARRRPRSCATGMRPSGVTTATSPRWRTPMYEAPHRFQGRRAPDRAGRPLGRTAARTAFSRTAGARSCGPRMDGYQH